MNGSVVRRWVVTVSCAAVLAVALGVGCTNGGTGSDAGEPDGSTICAGGTKPCGSICADTKNDPQNCGDCSVTCSVGEVCSRGSCGTTCGSAQVFCGGDGGSPYCANTKTDNANCGACGVRCGAGEVCQAGACRNSCVSTDGGGETLCMPDGGSPYCADEQTDNQNCGSCANVCGGGTLCVGGLCVNSCPAEDGGTLTLCTPDAGTPYCADTQTDPNNCGGCGTVCAAGKMCVGGACITATTFLAHDIEDFLGNAYMSSLTTSNVYKVTSSCSPSLLSSTAPVPGFSMAFNPINQTLYAVGQVSGNVYTVNTSTGTFTSWQSEGNLGNWIDGLWFDPTGNMFINDNGASKVLKVTPSGVASTFYSGLTSNNTQGTCDSAGNVYVPSRTLSQISEISPAGSLVATLTTSCAPWGIAWTGRNTLLYTCDSTIVYELDLKTLANTTFATPGGSSLVHLSVDASGNVWVGQWGGASFYKLSPSGSTLCTGTISGATSASF